MSKRDALLNLIHGRAPLDYTPAAFFMHFDPACHEGQAAVDKHLEYFRATDMDFVKIQFEQRLPPGPTITQAGAGAQLPRKALLQAGKLLLPRLTQVPGVGKGLPDAQQQAGTSRVLDAAQPTHELRGQATRNAVGQQEIELRVLRH